MAKNDTDLFIESHLHTQTHHILHIHTSPISGRGMRFWGSQYSLPGILGIASSSALSGSIISFFVGRRTSFIFFYYVTSSYVSFVVYVVVVVYSGLLSLLRLGALEWTRPIKYTICLWSFFGSPRGKRVLATTYCVWLCSLIYIIIIMVSNEYPRIDGIPIWVLEPEISLSFTVHFVMLCHTHILSILISLSWVVSHHHIPPTHNINQSILL